MIDPTLTAAPSAVGATASVSDPAETAAPPPGPSTVPAASPSAHRYVLGEEIARGGMGEVYRATDTVLNREVAVKVLQAKYGPTSAAAERFADEARITGQLQHPAIPPVHDLGNLPDGRPFLAMKLIKGNTLERQLKDRPEPSAERGKFVAVFEAICQAVAYAHAHGVIHRDLKPANVMVGNFAEVQVMDWGLAKVLGATATGGADPEQTSAGTAIRSLRDSDGSETQAGSVLGTPAYMPPEQAVGAVHQIDARSDVFGLGGILATILTGQPPFAGTSGEDTRVLAARGKVDDCFLRLDGCGAEPELVALAKRCLSPERDDRPADAGAVAAAVAGLRQAAEARARQAELDRVRVQGEQAVAGERRKRRRLWLAAGAAVAVVGMAALAGVVVLEARKAEQLQTERDAAREAETAAKAAEAAAKAAEATAAEQRKLAQTRLDQAVAAVESVILRVAGEKWAARPELQAERKQVLEEAIAFFDTLGATASTEPAVRRQAARANLFAATTAISLGEYDRTEALANAARTLYRKLRDDFPDDTAHIRGEAEVTSLLGHANAIRAKFTDALAQYEQVLALAQTAVAKQPDQADNQLLLADAYSSLALFYSFQRPDLSREYHKKALAVGEALLGRPSPGYRVRLIVATAQVNLAVSDINDKAARESVRERFAAVERQLRLLDRMPPPSSRVAEMYQSTRHGFAVYRGVLLSREGQMEEGLAQTKLAVEGLARMLAVQPNSFPFRIQHIQFSVIYADMLMRGDRIADAGAVMKQVAAEQAEIARSQPHLTWIKGLGQVQRANLLIHNIRTAFDPDDLVVADELAKEFGTQTPAVWYNVACAFAQAAAAAPPADRDGYAARAVKHLEGLRTGTVYFQTASNARHLDIDPDMDPIRKRPDYLEFLAKVQPKTAGPASPREVAPDPRPAK